MARPQMIDDVVAPVRGQDMPQVTCPDCGSHQVIGYHNGSKMDCECLQCGRCWYEPLAGVA